jgi:hypothetical protein
VYFLKNNHRISLTADIMKKAHKTIALAIVIAIALGILAMLIPKAASASTADEGKQTQQNKCHLEALRDL